MFDLVKHASLLRERINNGLSKVLEDWFLIWISHPRLDFMTKIKKRSSSIVCSIFLNWLAINRSCYNCSPFLTWLTQCQGVDFSPKHRQAWTQWRSTALRVRSHTLFGASNFAERWDFNRNPPIFSNRHRWRQRQYVMFSRLCKHHR
jgi:hypothetical protein